MIYELRTYWAAPGKLSALHRRFTKVTLGIFARHHMQVVAFWTPTPTTPETGDLVYILGFPNQAAQESAWNAFRSDPDWISGKAASEVDGVLVTRLTSVLLAPTDYSPLQ